MSTPYLQGFLKLLDLGGEQMRERIQDSEITLSTILNYIADHIRLSDLAYNVHGLRADCIDGDELLKLICYVNPEIFYNLKKHVEDKENRNGKFSDLLETISNITDIDYFSDNSMNDTDRLECALNDLLIEYGNLADKKDSEIQNLKEHSRPLTPEEEIGTAAKRGG